MNEMIFPQPCVNVPEVGDERAQIAKIDEELDELKRAWFYEKYEMGRGYSPAELRQARAATNEEIADTITACVTLLEMRGVDEAARSELFAKVNKKNRERGYLK